jgi:hypothetical protein
LSAHHPLGQSIAYALGDVDPARAFASNRFAFDPFDANTGAPYPRGGSIAIAVVARVARRASVVIASVIATRLGTSDVALVDARGRGRGRSTAAGLAPVAVGIDIARRSREMTRANASREEKRVTRRRRIAFAHSRDGIIQDVLRRAIERWTHSR